MVMLSVLNNPVLTLQLGILGKLLGLMGRIVKRCVMEVSLAQVSCILMYVYVAPPTPVGAWSMALGLRQRFEYYYYYLVCIQEFYADSRVLDNIILLLKSSHPSVYVGTSPAITPAVFVGVVAGFVGVVSVLVLVVCLQCSADRRRTTESWNQIHTQTSGHLPPITRPSFRMLIVGGGGGGYSREDQLLAAYLR